MASSATILNDGLGFEIRELIKRASSATASPERAEPLPPIDSTNTNFVDPLSTVQRKNCRGYIKGKLLESGRIIHDFFENQNESLGYTREELIENWRIWYFCMKLSERLGGEKAKEEIKLELESKKDFYEYGGAHMLNEEEIITFYEAQLIAIGEDIE